MQALGASKQGEKVSGLLLAAMREPAREVLESVEEQFKLLDLVAPEVQKDISRKEKELFIKTKKAVSKPRQSFRTHFDKQQIKQGAAIQREQQMKKAEEALKSKNPEEEALQEIDEEEMQKEQLKKERAERQARRVKEREEEEQQAAQTETAEMGMKGGRKSKKDKKDHGSKKNWNKLR